MKLNKYFDHIAAPLIFLAGFFLYLTTLCPSVYFGDSGELLAASYTLSIPHPTGFPLYLLLSKVFGLLPSGTYAFRVNLLSALFGAAVPALAFMSIRAYINKQEEGFTGFVLPVIASLLLVFSFTLWSQSTIARIYSMNGFFCALALYLFISACNSPGKNIKHIYMLAFITGAGAGLHLTFVVFSLLLWGYIVFKNHTFVKQRLPVIILLFLTGLSSYLYIIIRAAASPVIMWQEFGSISDFISYFTQQQYTHKIASRSSAGFLAFLSHTKNILLREFTPAGFIIFIAGAAWAFKKRFKYNTLFLLLFFANIIILALYGHSRDLNLSFRYYIPSYIIQAFYIFLFFRYLFLSIKTPVPAAVISLTVLLYLLAAPVPENYFKNNKSNNHMARNYPKDILEPMKKNSYLFTSGDNQIYTIAYYKYVKGKKKDTVIFDNTNTIFKDIDRLIEKSGSTKTIANIVTAFKQGLAPLYSTADPGSNFIRALNNGYVLRLADEKSARARPYFWQIYSLRGILTGADIFHPFEEREVAGTYLYKLAGYYKEKGEENLYPKLLKKAAETGYDSVPVLGNVALRMATYPAVENGPSRAEELYLKALELDPDNESINFNLGSLYGRLGMLKKAAAQFKKVTEINPKNANAYIYYNNAVNRLRRAEKQKALEKAASKNYHKGAALFKKKEYEKALGFFKKDTEENPGLDRSYFHIGLIHLYKNELKEALPWLKKAYGNNPKNTATLNNLGLLHNRLGNSKKARKYLKESLKIKPGQERIARILNNPDN